MNSIYPPEMPIKNIDNFIEYAPAWSRPGTPEGITLTVGYINVPGFNDLNKAINV